MLRFVLTSSRSNQKPIPSLNPSMNFLVKHRNSMYRVCLNNECSWLAGSHFGLKVLQYKRKTGTKLIYRSMTCWARWARSRTQSQSVTHSKLITHSGLRLHRRGKPIYVDGNICHGVWYLPHTFLNEITDREPRTWGRL
jgi:hypothetical protein